MLTAQLVSSLIAAFTVFSTSASASFLQRAGEFPHSTMEAEYYPECSSNMYFLHLLTCRSSLWFSPLGFCWCKRYTSRDCHTCSQNYKWRSYNNRCCSRRVNSYKHESNRQETYYNFWSSAYIDRRRGIRSMLQYGWLARPLLQAWQWIRCLRWRNILWWV